MTRVSLIVQAASLLWGAATIPPAYGAIDMALSKQQQIIFDRYMEMVDRPSGSAIATEYKRGLDGHRSTAHRDSLAFAAYQAGVTKRNIAAAKNC